MGKRWTQTEGQWPEVMKSAAHQYEDKLLEFAYGELPQHVADAVDAHVRGCTRCSQSLTEIRGVRATMSKVPMVSAPDAGLESLMAYADQAAKRNGSKTAPSIWKRFLMPLASVMALAVVGVVGFRANKEFDTSPASAAADQKVAERSKQQQDLPTQAALAPVAATPLPDGAPKTEFAGVEKADPKKLVKQENKNQLEDLREAGGKRGDVWAPEPKQSATRRAVPSKVAPVGNDEQVYRDDYSNAVGRGALAKDAPPPEAPPPPPAVQAQDKVNFGLGAKGSGSSSNEGGVVATKPAPTKAPAPERERQKEEAKKKEDPPQPRAEEAAPAPAPATIAAPAPVQGGYSQPSAKKSKGRYDLRPMTSSTGGSAADLDDSVALQKSDSLGVNRDAKYSELKKSAERTQSLESARVASNRGDRPTEIRLAAQVLESGATGYERVEALKRICDAYEALGEPDRADPFCDQLLQEFPNTVAAKAVSDRRKQVQRAPAPAKAKSLSPTERKVLDEAQPSSKPASSY